MICWSVVSRPVRVTRKVKAPVRLIVAPTTMSPGPLSTGSGSPVIMLSSTAEAPSSNLAVERDFLARTHQHPVSDSDVRHRHLGGFVFAHDARRLRLQPDQLFDGRGRLPFRPLLQEPPHQDQRDDHRRRLEIDVRHPARRCFEEARKKRSPGLSSRTRPRTPRATSVFMSAARWRSARQAPAKNDCPAHTTTGVVSANRTRCTPGKVQRAVCH